MLQLDLKEKTAVIAGSTQGIGLASAQALASLGANCVLMARNEQKLGVAVGTLDTSKGQKHSFLVADFQKPEEVKAVIGLFAGSHGVDILINNSGGPAGGPITEAKTEDFLSALQQHLFCNHILTQAVIPHMKQTGYGRIVNVISTSVKVPLKNLGVSNTTRAAVASWAKTMANELGKYGITVNNVLPGATLTERLSTIIDNKVSKARITKEEAEKEMLNEIPAGRFGKPEEIAAMVAFLCTPAAAYVNGTSIPVDGGRTGSI